MKRRSVIILLVFLFAFLTILGLFKIFNLDIWLHLSTGGHTVKTLSVPKTNIFSWMNAQTPMDDDKYGFQVIVYLIFQALGATGLILFRCLLILSAFGLVLANGFKKNLPFFSIAVVALAALTASERFLVRPDLASLFFFSLYLLFLERFGPKKRGILFLLPFLQILWANIHGYFILGIVLIWIYAVTPWIRNVAHAYLGKGWKIPEKGFRLPMIGVLSMAACFLNPYGAGVALFPIRTLLELEGETRFLLENINEFASPLSGTLAHCTPIKGFKILLLLSAGSLLLYFLRSTISSSFRKASRYDTEKIIRSLLILAAVIPMSLNLRRNISLLAIAAPPILLFFLDGVVGTFMEKIERSAGGKKRWLSLVSPLILGGVLLFAMQQIVSNRLYFHDRTPKRFGLGFSENNYPFEGIQFIKKNSLPRRVFNSFDFGALYVYNFFPEKRAYIDGNTFGCPAAFIAEYHRIRKGEQPFQPYFDEHGIDLTFLKLNTPLNKLLYEDPEWKLIFFGKVSAIFLRNKPDYMDLIARYSIDLGKNPPDPIPAKTFLGEKIYRTSILDGGIYPPYYQERARFYGMLGFPALAIRELEEALKVSTSFAEFYGQLAVSYAILAEKESAVPNLKKAEEYYQSALEVGAGSETYKVYINLAKTCYRLGELTKDQLYFEKAREYMEKGVGMQPRD